MTTGAAVHYRHDRRCGPFPTKVACFEAEGRRNEVCA